MKSEGLYSHDGQAPSHGPGPTRRRRRPSFGRHRDNMKPESRASWHREDSNSDSEGTATATRMKTIRRHKNLRKLRLSKKGAMRKILAVDRRVQSHPGAQRSKMVSHVNRPTV